MLLNYFMDYNMPIGGGKNVLCISALRFISMGMIIACHFCQYHNNELAWWLNIGVQCFFILSGFLYGTKKISEPIKWLSRNFVKVLIPYYTFLICALALYVCFTPSSLQIKSVVKAVFCVGTIDGLGHLWFVGYILFCYFLTPFLFKFSEYIEQRNFKSQLGRIFGLLVVYMILGMLTQSYFKPDRVLCYLVGYFSSFLIQKHGVIVLKWILWSCVPLAFLSKFSYVYYKFIEPNISLCSPMYRLSHIFMGTAVTFVLMFLLMKVKLLKCSKLLTYSDKYSYSVYLVHQLFILSPLTLMTVVENKWLSMLIILFVIILSALLLHWFSSKMFCLFKSNIK